MRDEPYQLTIDSTLDPCPAILGLVWAEGLRPPTPTLEPPAFLQTLISAAQDSGEEYVPLDVRQRVRKVLRYGKYKPSGRGKPASEFLLRAALQDTFPLVNGPVDVNNAISLESGFPGSIFDTARSGRDLRVRRGFPEETYVFNTSGQTIDLQDLLLICRNTESDWHPCGNPVKDAMETKISSETSDVVAVLYMPIDEPIESAQAWLERYAQRLHTHCGAERTGFKIIYP